ncbi:hypothetical protein AA106556_0199 [Neokomagataea tanensis NBRC 106556]|uniref:Uncharacterized protein n=2 Tax=Acetobacteraceae TaxID=433 RepID=A0ABQ0QGD1_9PROT|nr:hypothetical protein AA106556_0199 [Neokomagataea tanensis NBRC 106556]
MWLLARGRSIGMVCFEPGVASLMAALAPSLAVAIIACGLTFQTPSTEWGLGLVRALIPLTCTLLQLVVSHAYARWVRREGLWTRYATASLWCAWLPLLIMSVSVGLLKGFFPHIGTQGILCVVVMAQFYGLWLTWYTSKIGLLLTHLQALCVTIFQILSVVIMLIIIRLLPPYYNVLADMIAVN